MRVQSKLSLALALGLSAAVSVNAQFLHIGDPDVKLPDMTSGGKPATLEMSPLSDITSYAFDGSDLEIPFVLNGSGATVWLIIYTEGYEAPFTITGEGPGPYQDPEHAAPGWHVFGGTDVLVYKSAGERFDEGENTIVWNGLDMEGNVVMPGSYQMFLAAFDDEATPHVVGMGKRQFGGSTNFYINTERGEMIDFLGIASDMENDWITSGLDAFDTPDFQSVIDACGDREGCPTAIKTATPLNADFTEWIGNNRGGGVGWMYRFQYDWDTKTVTMVEDWAEDAGAVSGILSAGDILPGRQDHSVTNPEGTVIYATAGVSGTVSKIAAFSVADGTLLDEWDMSDMWLYDNKGSDRSSGPGTLSRFYDGTPDPAGLTMSGHHTSLTVRMSYDGDLIYMNRNGDGYGDSKTFSEGTFGDFEYGHTEAPAFKYTVYSTKWGWVTNVEAGSNTTQNGFVLGEDGSGLFHFEPKSIPTTWPQYNMIVDGDTDWDGVYMMVGGFGDDAVNNDFVPIPEEGLAILSQYPVVHLPYDQKRALLGDAATAVAELEGAALPTDYAVSDAAPNPFNPETSINFSLPWDAPILVEIYNSQGQKVRTLFDDRMNAGEFRISWDGRDDGGLQVASGMYMYRVQAPNLNVTKKVTLLK
ncbi:MAG: FlgD immunoglobulin-like domain containing protein [Candidatus Latescibacterota bacterium]|nr:FlgD immunoglobulin-like domain containing protein [Candidatus Latescibacterota bacterium]